MFILDPADTSYCDSVRRLLGGVDEIDLPNEDIQDPVILTTAELQILDLLPALSNPTPPYSVSEMQKIRLATIHIVAGLLCPTMPARIDVKVKAIDTSWEKRPVNYEELSEKLFATADTLLAQLGATDQSKVNVFAIAPSKRSVSEE